MIVKAYGFVIFPIIIDTEKNTSQWATKSWQWQNFSWILKLIWWFGWYPKWGCPSVAIYQKIDWDTQREVFHIITKR